MIVSIGGWVYVAIGVLDLLLIGEVGRSFGARAAALFTSLFVLAVGVGLLRRLNWGRWLALGMSVLTWTVGSLALLIFLAYMLDAIFEARSGKFAMFVATVLFVAVFGAFVVLNFRLYHHLTSEDGKFEFNAPEFESRPVLKSAALQLAIPLVFTLAGVEDGWPGRNRASSDELRAEIMAAQSAHAKRLERERDIQRQNDDAAARALNEQQQVARARARDLDSTSNSYGGYTSAQRSELEIRPATSAAEKSEKESTPILKCRDASGSISFTQHYCPPGTTQVESPRAE